jgi:ABC-type uncharacterized transport system involved in gliding motility auxiliary subunit
LTSDNFAVEKLVLAQQAAVPDDASVVIVAGPTTDFYPNEVESLRKYLRKGGKALFMLDPPDKADSAALPNLTTLVKEYGVDVGDNVIVDVSGIGQLLGTDASVPVAANYPQHPITENFNLLTAYAFARAVTPAAGNTQGPTAMTFIETSPRSWAETDVKTLTTTGRVEMEEAQGDKPGPVSVGAAVSITAPDAPAPTAGTAGTDERKPETRVAVIGDSDFPSNAWLGIRGNRDLFLNTVNWLAQQENLIAVRPRQADDRRITLTADQQRRIVWLSLLFIPGAVLGAGVYTWWRRR